MLVTPVGNPKVDKCCIHLIGTTPNRKDPSVPERRVPLFIGFPRILTLSFDLRRSYKVMFWPSLYLSLHSANDKGEYLYICLTGLLDYFLDDILPLIQETL